MYFPKRILLLPVIVFLFSSLGHAQSESEAPKIKAVGDQFYCPLNQMNVVSDFSITGPADLEIDAFYIQISSGYAGGDVLRLNDYTGSVADNWDSNTGKLTLTKPGGFLSYQEIIDAVNKVIFTGTQPDFFGEKFFSFTLGNANFLPSTGHFYEFVSVPGISWTLARTFAEERTYYGLPGYLATVSSLEEAILTGEQAEGTGWIGASDAELEGTWKWVTGPESGTVFWMGDFNGYAPNGAYENWNANEPNNLNDEDYGHVITNPSIGPRGSWNDLPVQGGSGDYAAQGYIVEYGFGGPDDAPDFSAFTRIYTSAIDSIFSGSNCGPGQVLLRATPIEIDTIPKPVLIQWFDTETATSPVHIGETFSPDLEETTNFYVMASEEGCTVGKRSMVTASIYEIPDIEKEVTLKNCDQDEDPTDGFTDFNLNEANELISIGNDFSEPPLPPLQMTYYLFAEEAESATNPLDPFPFNNQTAGTVYARVENADGCFDIAIVHLEVSATQPVEVITLESCDLDDINDGKFTFDLTQATSQILVQLPPQNLVVQYYRNLNDATIEQNEILPQTAYMNEEAFYQGLFVRVESKDNGDCISLGEFVELVVYPLPEFQVIREAVFCVNLEPITISVENPQANYSYQWSNASGETISSEASVVITSGGTYTVIARSDLNCESKPIEVRVSESSVASISKDDIDVVDGGEMNSIKINDTNAGIGDYEYALNEGPFQEEPFFDQVPPGVHVLSIQDKNGCGIQTIQVYVIGYTKFFTPNGDGYNDTWQVLGILSQPASTIFIYNKFGKLLAEIDALGDGWDGIYNGKLLPPSDYWYLVQLEDGRVHRGHFSLISR